MIPRIKVIHNLKETMDQKVTPPVDEKAEEIVCQETCSEPITTEVVEEIRSGDQEQEVTEKATAQSVSDFC